MVIAAALLPGVRLRRLAAGAGPDAIEALEGLRGQRQLEGAQAAGQLVHGPRPDDGRGHLSAVEQPGEGDVGRRFAELAAETLVRLELPALALDRLLLAIGGTPAFGELADRAAEEAPRERAPRDQAEPMRPARRDHLQIDGALREVVEARLRHQPEEMARRGGGARLRDVPAGEVAAPDVEHLACATSTSNACQISSHGVSRSTWCIW